MTTENIINTIKSLEKINNNIIKSLTNIDEANTKMLSSLKCIREELQTIEDNKWHHTAH